MIRFDENNFSKYEIGIDEKGGVILREYVVCAGDNYDEVIKRNVHLYCIEYSENEVKFYTKGVFKKQDNIELFFRTLNDRTKINNFKMPKINDRVDIFFLEENMQPRFIIKKDFIIMFLHYSLAVKNLSFLNLTNQHADTSIIYAAFSYNNMPDVFINSFKEFCQFLLEKTSEIEKFCHIDSPNSALKEKQQVENDASSSSSSDVSRPSYIDFFKNNNNTFFNYPTHAEIKPFLDIKPNNRENDNCLIL